jgi:hypothetical protein
VSLTSFYSTFKTGASNAVAVGQENRELGSRLRRLLEAPAPDRDQRRPIGVVGGLERLQIAFGVRAGIGGGVQGGHAEAHRATACFQSMGAIIYLQAGIGNLWIGRGVGGSGFVLLSRLPA